MTDYSNTEQIYKTHFLPENHTILINPTTIDLLTRDYQHDKPDRIMFASDSASNYSKSFSDRITPEFLTANPTFAIPRIYKSLTEQKQRTRGKAEVFTPAWVINNMNNLVDSAWFSEKAEDKNTKQPFNIEDEKSWATNADTIDFSAYSREPIEYITSTRLEITCGEAPFVVSRYNAATGEFIPVQDRVGLLDRKFRICNEVCNDEREWFCAVLLAYQSMYGYEYQGDNLLVARLNLLYTFAENYEYKFRKLLNNEKYIKTIAEIIGYNLWQMDGLTNCLPTDKEGFDLKWLNKGKTVKEAEKNKNSLQKWIEDNDLVYSKIINWKQMGIIKFVDVIKGSE